LARAGFNAEEIIGKIPILPRGDPGPSGDDKIDSAKAFTKGGSLNVEGKAAWDDHRRRQAETLAFLNQSAEQPVEHPRAISGGGALDQPGQEFGAIMLTRKPHASEVAAWPVDWRQALT
jgi:hypothetical protein